MEKYLASLESNDMLSKTLKNQEEIIKSLEVANDTAKAASDALNKTLVKRLDAIQIEKYEILNEYVDQANCWKKEIGIANRNHLKLMEKLQLLENDDITNQAEGNFHTKDQADEVITVNSVDNAVPQPTNLIGTCSICSIQIYDHAVE